MAALDFQRPDFGLFSNLLGRIPREERCGEWTGLAKLADFHGQEVLSRAGSKGNREACVDEQGAPG